MAKRYRVSAFGSTVQLIVPEQSVRSESLDGMLGAIVPSHLRGQPSFSDDVRDKMHQDTNIYGNTDDLGSATHDFSKALMQYMGTEYEAIFGSSSAAGMECMPANLGSGEEDGSLVGLNDDIHLSVPVSEGIGNVWFSDGTRKVDESYNVCENIDSIMSEQELDQIIATCTTWTEPTTEASSLPADTIHECTFHDKETSLIKSDKGGEIMTCDKESGVQRLHKGIMISEERARANLIKKQSSNVDQKRKDKGIMQEYNRMVFPSGLDAARADSSVGLMGKRPIINITNYPNIDPYQIKALVDWCVVDHDTKKGSRSSRAKLRSETKPSLRVRPQSFKRVKTSKTIDINEVPDEEIVDSAVRVSEGADVARSSSDSAEAAEEQSRRSK